MKSLIMAALLAGYVPLVACTKDYDNSTVKEFDLERYLGLALAFDGHFAGAVNGRSLFVGGLECLARRAAQVELINRSRDGGDGGFRGILDRSYGWNNVLRGSGGSWV